MRTAGSVDGDFRFTIRTLFFCFFFRFFFRCMPEFIDLTDQQEYDEADNQEINNLCQKGTVIDGGGIFTASKDDYQVIKINLAGKDTE